MLSGNNFIDEDGDIKEPGDSLLINPQINTVMIIPEVPKIPKKLRIDNTCNGKNDKPNKILTIIVFNMKTLL